MNKLLVALTLFTLLFAHCFGARAVAGEWDGPREEGDAGVDTKVTTIQGPVEGTAHFRVPRRPASEEDESPDRFPAPPSDPYVEGGQADLVLAPPLGPGGADPARPEDGEILDIQPTKEYVDVAELDASVFDDAVTWEPNNARFLYFPKNRCPFVYLTGTVKPGYELSFEGRWIQTHRRHFRIKVPLALGPRTFELKVFTPLRDFRVMHFLSYWHHLTRPLELAVLKGNAALKSEFDFVSYYHHSGFAQLYSGKEPISLLDLDAQKHTSLTMRLLPAPLPEESYTGWRLVIRNRDGKAVAELVRYGTPPPFVDWREIGTGLIEPGSYTYQLFLYKDDTVFEGGINSFEAFEGMGLAEHHYLPTLRLEPQFQLGSYAFRNGYTSYRGAFAGLDFPVTIVNRFLFRATGQFALFSPCQNENFMFTRLGIGYRLYGNGYNAVFGRPHLYQVDFLMSHDSFTVYPSARVQRMTNLGFLIESKIALWGYHTLVPWAEFGTRTNATSQHISLGLSYDVFIRPWSMWLGMGLSYDSFYRFDDDPNATFRAFRGMAKLTFDL